MRFPLVLIAMNALSVQAQLSTNAAVFSPVDPIAGARSPVREPESGRISTNTPAFEKYGLNLMLSEANRLAERWKLGVKRPLTVNDVFFSLKATASGIEGTLSTRDGRYDWLFMQNAFYHFCDDKYWPRSFSHMDH